jgi:malonyl-ACP decarboxylase
MPEDGELTSLVVGGQNLMGAQEHAWLPRLADEPSYVSPQAAIRLLDSDVVGSVSEAFGLMGEGSLVGGASASGNLAIVQACRLLRSGRSERCVVLGALAELSALQLQAFCNIGALGGRDFLEDPGSACRPFDRKQGGFIPGEASACLILEREEAALARGIEPHAYVLGGAATLHGDHGADASSAAILRAMRLACEDAAVSPASIDYINAHATGTPRGDAAELSAIRELLGRRIGDVPINSTKSIVGHCLWSAGVVEAIAVVLQMSGKFIHPNRNLCEPTEAGIALVGEQAIAADASLALSNALGFGGIDTTVVIGQCRRSAPSLPR